MRKLKLFFAATIAFCLLSAAAFSQNQAPKFSLVEVAVKSMVETTRLLSQGFDIDFKSKTQLNKVRIIAKQSDLSRLSQLGYNYSVIHNDLAKFQQERLIQPKTKSLEIGQGSMGGYFTYDELLEYMDSIQTEYPDIMSAPTSIGLTIEGREILAFKISDNPEVKENEPSVLIDGLHHAREPMSIVASLYYAEWLLDNYGTDEMATYIVDNREIWFVPIVNVDGYVYNEETNPNGGGMWRKNKRNNDENDTFNPAVDGVDLNRNYGYGWGYDNIGSSDDPSSETYRGASAFSEPETDALRQFCIEKGFKTALNFHTFGDLMIYPEEPDGTIFPDHAVFQEYGHDATKANGYIYGNGTETVQYVTNGDTDAWMYGEQTEKDKIMAFTPEIGNGFDYFWAPTSRIVTLAEENLYLQQYVSLAAGAYLKIEDYSFDDNVAGDGDMAAEAGETAELKLQVRNKGWDIGAESVTATLSCDDELVTIETDAALVSFTALETKTLSFTISLAEEITSGHTALIDVNFTNAAGYNLTETYEITFGKPSLEFFDNAENGIAQWSVDGTWGLSPERSPEGEHSFTDSPYGTYSANDEISLTTATAINLEGLNKATLSFQTRYDIEKDWDLAQLQVSTDDGSTWDPLWGEYATNGSDGDGLQSSDEPVYNGFRDLRWVEETASLDAYLGQQVLIRFMLASDMGVQTDGWYVDDVKVIGYTDLPGVPQILSFTEYQNTSFLGAYPVSAVITDEQGNLAVDLKYSTDNVTFSSIEMTTTNFFDFSADIPMMELGTTVYYYIEVTDEDNNTVSTDMQQFLVTNESPIAALNITEITSEMGMGQNEDHILTIANNGLLPLTWSMTGSSAVTKDPVLAITDPEGDNQGGSPDIVSVSTEIIESTSIYMQMDFADDINANTMFAVIIADTDQNPETGATGEDMFGYPGWDIGSEYAIFWDPGNQNGMGSVAFVTDELQENIMGTADITIEGEAMWITLPLSILGNDDGNMDIASICGSEAGFDAAPNEGHGTAGTPGFASWLSYDISEGTIYAGESMDITITTSSEATPPGIYQADLSVETNDPANTYSTIPVSMTVLSNETNIETFSFDEQYAPATFNNNTRTIAIMVNESTNVENLIAEFTLSEGATAYIGDIEQASGITSNNFSSQVQYRIVAADGETERIWKVNVSVYVGIDETTNNTLSIYPNPASYELNISGITSGRATIYSITGQKVLQLENEDLQQPIDISMLQNGLYVVNILEKNVSKSELIQINR
ncbi:MAG: M14 family zinc carboxypeptidase [Salinivirgaceae bacterium]|jgi:carboxypeptidase T|nr:M14 family zinc carboxypeptidase [Salinivirgaceae bacterium]